MPPPLPVLTIFMVSQYPVMAAMHLGPNNLLLRCYHLLLDDLQLHLLILMPFTLLMYTRSHCLLSPPASVPPCRPRAPAVCHLGCNTEHPSTQLHRGEERAAVEQEGECHGNEPEQGRKCYQLTLQQTQHLKNMKNA